MPSSNSTVTLVAPEITWLFVKIKVEVALDLKIEPDPFALPVRVVIAILTTEGRRVFAIDVTLVEVFELLELPALPVTPAKPCAPVAPVGPAGPAEPGAPFAPAGPAAPAGPCGPAIFHERARVPVGHLPLVGAIVMTREVLFTHALIEFEGEIVLAANAPPPTSRAPTRKPAPTLAPLPAPRLNIRREALGGLIKESDSTGFSALTDRSSTTSASSLNYEIHYAEAACENSARGLGYLPKLAAPSALRRSSARSSAISSPSGISGRAPATRESRWSARTGFRTSAGPWR